MITVRLYTEVLGPEQVGKLSLLLALTSLFTLALIAPVSSYVMRKAIDWHSDGDLAEHLKKPLLYSLAAASIAAIVSELLAVMGVLHASLMAGPLVGLAVLGLALSNAGSQLFNYLGRPFTFVTLSCLTSCAAVAIPGLLCWLTSSTAEMWIVGVALGQLAGGCLSILFIKRLQRDNPSSNGELRRASTFDLWTVASYSAPLLIATCLSWVQTDGYRYVFVRVASEHILGLFVVGFTVGVSPMALVDRLISDVYLPTLTRDVALKSRDCWPASWNAYASAAILPIVLFGMLACSGTTLLARLLIAPAYVAYAWVGIWGGMVKALQMMTSLYVGFSYAALNTKHLAVPYLIGACTTLLSMALLMSELGHIEGLATSLVFGALTVLICMSCSAEKLYGVRFPYAALSRSIALGVPVVLGNWVAKRVFHDVTVFAAIGVLGCEVIYIASVCWFLYPKSPTVESFKPSVVPEMVVQEVEI